MKRYRAFRKILAVGLLLGAFCGQGVFAKAKSPDFTGFVGAYSGDVSFPTTLYGISTPYAGPGILLVTSKAKGKQATIQFICAVGAPLALGIGLNITSQLGPKGTLKVTGQINGSPFNTIASKYKLRGKSLATSYTLVDATDSLTLALKSTIKFSGKSVMLSGPATFTFTGGESPGTFVFTGKRVLQ